MSVFFIGLLYSKWKLYLYILCADDSNTQITHRNEEAFIYGNESAIYFILFGEIIF